LGVSTVITLPAGNYSRRNITPILADLLNNASISLGNNWTYAVSYPGPLDVDTGRLTFSVIGNTGQPQIYVHTRDPSLILGLSMDTWHDFVEGSMTSDNVIDMSGSRHMYIQSNITEENEGIILELENDSAFMGSAVYRCPEIMSYSRVLHPQKSNVYSFNLIDHNGEIINLNGAHMSITLILYKHSDTMDLIRKTLPYLLRTIT